MVLKSQEMTMQSMCDQAALGRRGITDDMILQDEATEDEQ
jgi:hypothetical protein